MSTLNPPQPAVSSSSTLWATASKEWVIPAKPKPGRKPKKDAQPVQNDEEEVQLDSKGRRVQNRAAQRAFRERKQSQLADLQARIQLYEQGEIERNVALQTIAKRLKEENEKLRSENDTLKQRVSLLEGERDAQRDSERKRWREDSASVTSTLSVDLPARKRVRTSDSLGVSAYPSSVPYYSPSPPSIVSSPETVESAFSPVAVEPASRAPSIFSGSSAAAPNYASYGSGDKPSAHGRAFSFDCGFCNDETPCVCREIALQQVAAEQAALSSQQHAVKMENTDPNASTVHDQAALLGATPSAPMQISILDNPPPYQPPVPLKRRAKKSAAVPVISFVSPAPASGSCSGDPSNCAACADDSFGKAFCTALGASASADTPCAGCPNASADVQSTSSAGTDPQTPAVAVATSERTDASSDTIPTDDAWRQLKSHPNVAFADLALLADVVARRSKCTGPRVVISPALGSITPERVGTPAAPAPDVREEKQADGTSVLLTDPHAHYREQQRHRSGAPAPASPRLVPEEVLIQCGRKGVREVRTEALQEALRMLDAKFT